jgi:nuclear receptor interaction protein
MNLVAEIEDMLNHQREEGEDRGKDEEENEENEDEDDDDDDSSSDEDDFLSREDEDDLIGEPVYDNSFVQMYKGHCNVKTVKEVDFFGARSEYIVSGSDDGNIFIWNKKTGNIVQILEGDRWVVNCIHGHPYDCVLVSSGIENGVKLWTPTADKLFTPGKDAQDVVERNLVRVS